MIFLLLIIGMIVFDIAALKWGSDSREKIDDPEWERRRAWWSATATSNSARYHAPINRVVFNSHAWLN